MKTFVAVLSLCLSAAAQAQPVPSVLIPIAPCRVFDSRVASGGPGPITGGSTVHLTVRGVCTVPENATAVDFSVSAVSPAANGNLLVWEENLTKPTATTLTYNTTATFTTGGKTRLCYPILECSGVDLQIQPSQTTEVVFDVTGAYVPLDSIESTTSAIAGKITEIHEAQAQPEGTYYDLTLDSGLHVSCDPAHIATEICAEAEAGDQVTAAGHVETFFGAVHVYAHDLAIQ